MTRTQAELAAIARDGDACLRCGRNLQGIPASVHHRLKRSAGTKAQVDRVENLVVVCGSGTTGCHWHIHDQPHESFDDGWMVRRGADPAGKPLTTTNGTLLILLPDGSVVSNSLAGINEGTPF